MLTKEAVQHAGESSALRPRFCFGFIRGSWLVTKVISIVAQFIVSLVSLVPAGMYMYCCTVFRSSRDEFFDSCIQSGKIADALVVQRIKLAKKRHDHTFFHNINQKNRNPASVQSQALDGIFPPRGEWIKLGRQKRHRLSPIKRNLESLRLTLEKFKKMPINSRPDWYEKLDKLTQEISLNLQKRSPPQFSAPEILPVPKKKGSELYRPIAAFQLNDQLMIGAVSRYIREKIDPVFMKCSYAFRAKPKGGKQCPTHHDAVQNLIAFRQKHAGKTLYVAECDIQKFFDILNHRQIRLAFGKVIKELKLATAHKIDGRAIQHFVNYLECYSYETEAKAGAQKYFDARKMKGCLDTPDEKELGALYSDPQKVKYGVPQGGALSPIIANIVLHWADVAIFQAYGSRPLNDLFYARYCDDMIIVHPDKKVCQELLDTYIKKLFEMKLLVHKPKDFTRYDKEFFDVKSKNPYPWNEPHADRSTVPWVSFVGYQIGHEGQIRIRADLLPIN